MRENEELLKLATMGIDAEVFFASPLGRFLKDKAQRERQQAIDDLVAADPADIKANTELRNQIHVVGMFLTWLEEAIQCGQSAHMQLRELEAMGE